MSDDIAALLREIRDNQREALQLQREHVALYLKQLDRVDRINGRAEVIQAGAGRLLKLVLYIAVPLLGLLILAMSWPYLRYFAFALTHR
jgi:ABC-type uncharacterized transport system involved in gliding motility auxiliary subunit